MAKCSGEFDFMKVFGGDPSDFVGFEDESDDEDCNDDETEDDFDPKAFAKDIKGLSNEELSFTGLDYDDEEEDDGSLDVASEWSSKIKSHKLGPFTGPSPGPKTQLDAEAEELDFFRLMFPPSLIERLAEETNRFAEKSDDKWEHVSVDEMEVFLGVRIFMSLTVVPYTAFYWSNRPLIGKLYVRKVISKKRFQQISANFCANDPMKQPTKDDPQYDKLYEIRPVLDAIVARCAQEYNAHQVCMVHGINILHVSMATKPQYRKTKPYDMQVLLRSDNVSGFCCDIQVYSGEVNAEERKVNPDRRFPSSMTVQLCERVKERNHIINMDTYFATPKVIKLLKAAGTLARGALSKDLRGFPTDVISKKKIVKHGDSSFAQQGDMFACAYAWNDRRIVRLMSTADNPKNMSTLDWEPKNVPYPTVLKRYNAWMGRMEKLDRSRHMHPTGRTSKRWWFHLFWCLFDIALSNAYILMRDSKAHKETCCKRKLSILEFRMNLSKQLMAQMHNKPIVL